MQMADGHGSKCKCCTLDCTYPATREPFLPLSRLIPQTFAGTVANVCRERRSALQGRMQCTAGAVAVHCGGGCSALRGRLQCTASEMGKTGTEMASPILDKR